MRYGSVCSGIEAATVAWHPLGWKPAFFSEIDKFPRQVLAHHYPDVPLHGDFTTIEAGMYADIDVLVGGTPCQSFSVAGLRKGLADPRGNLMLGFGALAQRLRPKFLVWENVPGVLSSNGGRDFGSFLGMLAELGYGFAYRVLDAQYFGVAQRRRRVFVVGCAGDWRRAAAVLFERASLRGDPAPSREAGKRIANALTDRADRGGTNSEGQRLIPQTVGALTDGAHMGGGLTDKTPTPAGYLPSLSLCLNAGGMGRQDFETETLIPTGGCFDVVHSLRGEGFDASEDGTGRGTPLVPVSFPWQMGGTMQMPHDLNLCGTLVKSQSPAVAIRTANTSANGHGFSESVAYTLDQAQGQAVAFTASEQANSYAWERDYAPTINAQVPNDTSNIQTGVRIGMQVRRLTPRECERLQGFPDNYTDIRVGGKATPDGPRYKALGNSMAVPVMAWIGKRIADVDAIGAAETQRPIAGF
jgi:DNA (cytosine-5)-methyltransferase 1